MSLVGIEEIHTPPQYSGGHFLPPADNLYDLGSAAKSWRNIYFDTAIYGGAILGDWNPSAPSLYDLGSATAEWQELYLGDDGGVYIGLDQDIRILNRSTTLATNTTLAGVLIGTPVTPALPANSLIVANVTADGDVLIAVNDGGHSKAGLWIDSSTPVASIYGMPLRVQNGDTDDYILLSVVSNVPTIYGTGAYLRVGDAATQSAGLSSEDDLMVTGKLEVDGQSYLDGNFVTGGATPVGYIQNNIGGTFTSDGGSTFGTALLIETSLTGAVGDTARLTITTMSGVITTQNNGETIDYAAQLVIQEPNITVGTDTITVAATLYVITAPTEGTTNAAIYVNSGDVNIPTLTARSRLHNFNDLIKDVTSEALADEASIVIATGTAGFGFVQAGDDEEYALFTWKADGTPNIVAGSANTVTTDTDTKLCIIDNGSGIAIKNSLGASKTIRYSLNYS